MATAICTEDTSVCSICYGHFINSRKLPGCNHAFCENCLLTYISTNQESNEDNFGEFKCPNCRRTIHLLESTEESVKDWVKSLEELKADENMTSNAETEGNVNNTICASCKDEDDSCIAEKYCVECGESLCSRCSRISHRTEQFRGHTIVDLQTCTESNKCDRSALQCLSEYLKCNKHLNKYVFVVCMDDGKLCCTECVIVNHRHCETFGKIETLSSKSENESAVKKTKDRIENIVSKIKDLVDLKKQSASENVTELKKKTEILTDKVKEIRTKINTLFDAVEANIASKVNAISKQCRIDVGDSSSQLEDISKKLTDYLAVIDQAIRVAPDSHSYIVLRKLESRIEEATMTITEICRDNCKYGVDLKITPAIQNLSTLGTNDADQLAEVIEEFEKIPLADLSDQCHPRGIKEMVPRDILPWNAPDNQPEYYGLVHTRCTSAKHRMLLVSKYGSFFCAADDNYKATVCFNKKVLTGEPYGLTELKHNVVAVGLPEEKKIVFLSENEESKYLELFGHIDTRNKKPKALCGLSNGDLAISYTEPVGFGILNFKCSLYANHSKAKIYFTEDKSGRTLKTFDFMAVDERRLHVIQPCTTDKAVYCFDFEGNPQFKYSHEDLVYRRGVGISVDGNIFISDQRKSVIHVISPVGQGLQVVREECPEKPLAIAFDPSGLQFAVSQNTGPWKKVRFFRLTEQIV